MDIKPKYTLEEMFLSGFDDNAKCCELCCNNCVGREYYNSNHRKCDILANFETVLYELRIYYYEN